MPKKILNGIVVSDKPNKSITVVVERKYQHPLFKKVMKAKKNITFTMKKISIKMEIKSLSGNANLILNQKSLKLLEKLNDTGSNWIICSW